MGGPVRNIRVFSVLAALSLLLGLLSAQVSASAAATPRHAGTSASTLAASHRRVSIHPTHLVPPVHPSLRVIHVRHVRVVRARGRVVRARIVPWPRRNGTPARTTASIPPATQRESAIRLTAYTGSGNGDVEFPTPTQPSEPVGVAVTPDDSAWFTEERADQIGRVTESGSFTEYPLPDPDYGDDPDWITVGADENLWFADGDYVGRITQSGSISMFPVGPLNRFAATTEATALGPGGSVWFTSYSEEGSYVGYVTPAGAVTEFQVDGSVQALPGITAGPDGAMWFVNESTEAIERITTAGALTEYQMPSDSTLYGITTGPDGRLWFGDTDVGAMTTSGSYTLYVPPGGQVDTSGSIAVDRSTGALVFVSYPGEIGQVTTSGLMSFAPTIGENLGAGQIGWAPDGTLWYTDVDASAIGMLPPGPAQFPPAVPTAQTYGCAPCTPGAAAQPEDFQGDPVNTATGAYSDTVTDAQLPGPGVAFAFTRAYTSVTTATGPLGPGWTDPYQASLSLGSGTATFTSGDGQQMVFTQNANGFYTGAPGVYATLAAVSGGYQLVAPDGTHLNFNTTGQLTSMTDRSGTGLTMTYTSSQLTSIKNAGGRVVTLAYTSGLLTKLTLPDARTVTYAYTAGC